MSEEQWYGDLPVPKRKIIIVVTVNSEARHCMSLGLLAESIDDQVYNILRVSFIGHL